jgi:dihydropteroate synthase
MKNTTQIMGILNLTPDSFYDGGSYNNETKILRQVEKMLYEGANCIDIGAYSSRPNAKNITEEEELSRLIPPLQAVVKTFPDIIISIDTFRSQVAKQAILNGGHTINDISGGNMDPKMFETVADLQVPYVLMHMQGTPQTMQNNPSYQSVTNDVYTFFQKKTKELEIIGVKNVILDVGFGFGKTITQNYDLLHNLKLFKQLNKQLLVGLSRKSMLYKLLKTKPEQALNATSVAHTIAILNGADILRVHDVKEAVEVVTIIKQLH